MSVSIGTKLGALEITAFLGKGGMGEVYRARDTKLGRDVALKFLAGDAASNSDRLSRFRREAQILAALNHPNIGAIFGLEESAGTTALVLELVEGPTLAERLRTGPVPLDEALSIAKQIVAALEAAHVKGIVHRDLKPANIKIVPGGKVKVLDFGLAKAVNEEGTSLSLSNSPTMLSAFSMPGMILGTVAYMSPEQARGKTVDKQTDIWAFGVVFFEMLTGRSAFVGETVTDILGAIVHKEPDWQKLAADTPASLLRLLRRCLAKDLRQRLHDIADALFEIEAALHEPPIQAATKPARGQTHPSLWLAVTAAVCLIAALALGFVHFRETPTVQPVLRYSMPLSKDALFISHAVSPDGRYIAVNQVLNDQPYILLRALDSSDFRTIAGTEGAQDFFWSADSQFIGFFSSTDNKLKKVSIKGGPAEELSGISGVLGQGGTWSRQGVIIVAADDGRLFRLSSDGGEAQPLTKPDRGDHHRYPFFLPEGNHFLYTSLGGADAGIYVASLDNPAGHRLLADRSSGTFVPTQDGTSLGSLIFIRENKVMVQRFDSKTLELSGNVSPLIGSGLLSDRGSAAVSVSDTGILTYLAGSNRQTDSQLAWFDRQGNRIAKEGMIGKESPVALSEDGKTVALIHRPAGGGLDLGDIYLRDVPRATEDRFTFGSSVFGNLVWAPDEGRLAFSANHSGSLDLYWKDIRSGEEKLLLTSGNSKYVTDWSMDGRFLIYTEIDQKTKADLWYLQLDDRPGTPREPIRFLKTDFYESAGQLSPDGQWMAYVSDESGDWEVYVRQFPSAAGKRKISTSTNIGSSQPQWSRDGRHLFYLTGPTLSLTLMTVPVKSAGTTFEAGKPQPLFDVRANAWHPAFGNFFYAVSADNKRFLVDYVEANSDPMLNVIVNWEKAFNNR